MPRLPRTPRTPPGGALTRPRIPPASPASARSKSGCTALHAAVTAIQLTCDRLAEDLDRAAGIPSASEQAAMAAGRAATTASAAERGRQLAIKLSPCGGSLQHPLAKRPTASRFLYAGGAELPKARALPSLQKSASVPLFIRAG